MSHVTCHTFLTAVRGEGALQKPEAPLLCNVSARVVAPPPLSSSRTLAVGAFLATLIALATHVATARESSSYKHEADLVCLRLSYM